MQPLWIKQHDYIFTNQIDNFIIFGGGKEQYTTFVINFNDLIKARSIFDYLKMSAAFDYAARIPAVVSTNNNQKKESNAIDQINGYLQIFAGGKIDLRGQDIYIYISNKNHEILERMKSVKRFIPKFNNLYEYDFNEKRNFELREKLQEYQKIQNLIKSAQSLIPARNTASGAVIDP